MFRTQQFRITLETLPPHRGKLASALIHWWHIYLNSPNSWGNPGQCNPHSQWQRGTVTRHPSLGLLLLWGIWNLQKVLTPRGVVCSSPTYCFESLWLWGLPSRQTHLMNTDTQSMTQARNMMMLFTTNDLHMQHKAWAFSGHLEKGWEEFQ